MAKELSKQVTNVTPVFSKLEWRIEHFENLMRLLNNGQFIKSEKFKNEKVPTVAWELHVYPNGKREEHVNNSTFFLYQVGLEPGRNQRSSVKADFTICVLGQNGTKLIVCHDINEFVHLQGRGKFRVEHARMKNVLQADGSLVVMCEIEFLSPNIKLKAELEPTRKVEKSLVSSAKIKDKLVGNQINSQLWKNKHFTDIQVRSSIMLEYMSTGSFDDPNLQTYAMDLLVASDKYEVIALKEVCEAYLICSLNNENIFKLVAIADTYSATHLKKACVSHIAMNHNTVFQSAQWKALKLEKPYLVNDLLELMIKEHSSQSFKDNTANISTPRINDQAPMEKKKRHF
ncbi:BTB and MATH domain-containing protein 42 [Ditylenchus destructor]|uniref:BTB and MATH domain-containing protein 42 n=1 Tax=Ditylenchus destructor TaxID=166010 RepID=A0AAD4QV63_9BILA|nr:BTB and MATH domain-containing protein 42 [Ditylenchus destructor]